MKRTDKTLEQIYAYISVIEMLNRVFLLANLWVSTKIFSFAVCFMDLISTGVLGMFFFNLFLQPILIHSPYFRTQFKSRRCAFYSIIGISYIVGPNFYRLLYSRVFGSKCMANEFNEYYFFVKPMNNIANFTLILTVIQAILCMINLFNFSIGEDTWGLSVLGIILNGTMIIFQLVKIIQTRRFVKKYEKLNSEDNEDQE